MLLSTCVLQSVVWRCSGHVCMSLFERSCLHTAYLVSIYTQTRELISMAITVMSYMYIPNATPKYFVEKVIQNHPPHSSSHLNFPETVLPPLSARIFACHLRFISQLLRAAANAPALSSPIEVIPLPRPPPSPSERRC